MCLKAMFSASQKQLAAVKAEMQKQDNAQWRKSKTGTLSDWYFFPNVLSLESPHKHVEMKYFKSDLAFIMIICVYVNLGILEAQLVLSLVDCQSPVFLCLPCL